MLSLLAFTLFTSLLLGMRHATDADHVVAVSTIVSRERSMWRAARVGALWGLGHTMTILAVGGAVVVFKVAISPRVGLSLEFAVAVMLIALGVFNMHGARTDALARPMIGSPLVVGLVHGLAGSGAASVFVLSLIPDPAWAMAALLVFCAGTVAGMSLVTATIAAPAAFARERMARLQRHLRFTAGALSFCFGLYLAHRIGFVDGLFTGRASWDPR
ncbi:MAG TPA: hypothetical protein VKA84_23250 [Gemmatimonadaceae bacterium]|nr:hypothetical protein [Gemmatimonadaceae bacterium]